MLNAVSFPSDPGIDGSEVFLNTRSLGRLSPLSGISIVCILSPKMTALISTKGVWYMRTCHACIILRVSRLLRCAHRQVRSCTVLISPTICACYKEALIRLSTLHSPLSVFHRHFFMQTGDTYQTEFVLARKRPWSDWTYCTGCSP